MKKLFFVTAIISIIICGSACKKEYTCTCRIINDTGNQIATEEATFKKSNKSDAESACKNNEIITAKPMEQAKCELK